MRKGEREQIERGMQLAADRPEIMPDQADARIQPIYEDIQRTLRVPFINLIFRTLANDPEYLVPAWRQLSPLARTRAFEQLADDLRTQSLVEPVPEASGIDREAVEELDRLRAFNDTIHYVLPKLLLVATALDEGLSGRGEDRAAEQIPLGVAEGTAKVQMVNPEEATGRVAELFARIKEVHNHPLVSSYYRALGNWPDFLEAVWERIEPRIGSESYEERKRILVRAAGKGIRGITGPTGPLAGAENAQTNEIRAILAAFRLKFIPEMMIDVAWIKAMLDGAEAATRSRFSTR